MKEVKPICKKCGHECHCNEQTCYECSNDVCTGCDCKEENLEKDND